MFAIVRLKKGGGFYWNQNEERRDLSPRGRTR